MQINVRFSQLGKVSSVYQLPLKILAYNWLSWFFTNPFQILLSSSQHKWVNFHHHHHRSPPPPPHTHISHVFPPSNFCMCCDFYLECSSPSHAHLSGFPPYFRNPTSLPRLYTIFLMSTSELFFKVQFNYDFYQEAFLKSPLLQTIPSFFECLCFRPCWYLLLWERRLLIEGFRKRKVI